jgi:hypothetical protein
MLSAIANDRALNTGDRVYAAPAIPLVYVLLCRGAVRFKFFAQVSREVSASVGP